MRKTAQPHLFKALGGRRPATGLLALLIMACLLAASGCIFKTKVKVELPPAILNAKAASFDDLIGIVRRYDALRSLSCNDLKLTFTSSRKIESGFLEKYPTLHGYIILKRPDSIHLVLLTPVTKSTLFDVLSIGDQFSVWSPRDGKFYEGKNSAKKLLIDDPSGTREFTVPRGTHIIEAIFPQSEIIDSAEVMVGVEVQKDTRSSYYVLSVIRPTNSHRVHIIRKIWIERAGLTIARQQLFTEDGDGEVMSDIVYSKQITSDGFCLPLRIHIDRPLDGYSLDLEFDGWKVNPDPGLDAFELKQPQDSQVIRLREK
jgi:hypothetical protein